MPGLTASAKREREAQAEAAALASHKVTDFFLCGQSPADAKKQRSRESTAAPSSQAAASDVCSVVSSLSSPSAMESPIPPGQPDRIDPWVESFMKDADVELAGMEDLRPMRSQADAAQLKEKDDAVTGSLLAAIESEKVYEVASATAGQLTEQNLKQWQEQFKNLTQAPAGALRAKPTIATEPSTGTDKTIEQLRSSKLYLNHFSNTTSNFAGLAYRKMSGSLFLK